MHLGLRWRTIPNGADAARRAIVPRMDRTRGRASKLSLPLAGHPRLGLMERRTPMAGKTVKLLKVGLFFLPIAVLVGLACIYYTVDEPPPEDADLLPQRVAIPREENGFFHVKLAWEDFSWKTPDKGAAGKPEAASLSGESSDDGSEEEMAPDDVEERIWSMLQGEEAWDQAFAAAILEANRRILEQLDKALSAPRFEFEPLPNTSAPITHLRGFMALSSIQRLKARLELEAGREARAVSETLKLIRLGHRAEEGKGCGFETAVAAEIASRGLEDLTDLVRRTGMGPDQLRPLLEELPRYHMTEEAFKESLKTEYSLTGRSLEELGVEKLADYYLMPGPSWFSRRLCFKPNATRRLYAEGFRAIRNELSAPPGKREKVDFDALSGGRVGWFPGRNRVGRSLFQVAMPLMERQLLRSRVGRELRLSFLRVLIALKCHKLSKGSFPRSLEELVPEFLPEVPLDPYDGKPLRYSADEKILYSIGADLEEAGGAARDYYGEGAEDTSEPTLRLEMPSS